MKISTEKFKNCLADYKKTFTMPDGDEVTLSLRPLTANLRFAVVAMLPVRPAEAHEYVIKASVVGWENVFYDGDTAKPVGFNYDALQRVLTLNSDLHQELIEHLMQQNEIGGRSTCEDKQTNFTPPPSESSSETAKAE